MTSVVGGVYLLSTYGLNCVASLLGCPCVAATGARCPSGGARVRYNGTVHNDVFQRLGAQQHSGERVVPRSWSCCVGGSLTATVEALTARHRCRRVAPGPGICCDPRPWRVEQRPLTLDPYGSGGSVQEAVLTRGDRCLLENDDWRFQVYRGWRGCRVVRQWHGRCCSASHRCRCCRRLSCSVSSSLTVLSTVADLYTARLSVSLFWPELFCITFYSSTLSRRLYSCGTKQTTQLDVLSLVH